MIISEKQLLLLIETLRDSVKFNFCGNSPFNIPHETRLNLLEAIINQQSDELIQFKNGSSDADGEA